MARVLFSVCGVGTGHAARTTPLIEALCKEHDVLVMSYGAGYSFLSKRFEGVKKLAGFSLFFENDILSKRKTFLYNIKNLPLMFWNNYNEMQGHARKFDPDFIVSDFEANALYLGKLMRKPVALISNMHLMEHIKPRLAMGEKLNYYLTEKPILKAFTNADAYLIPALYKPKEKEGNTFFFNPIVRKEILKQKPVDKGFLLVYIRRNDLSQFTKLLGEIAEQEVVVYTTDPENGKKSSVAKNVTPKDFNEKAFAKDLASCSGVFTHGGISVLSEAMVLAKPSFTLTEQNFFERYYNGLLVQQQGYGVVESMPSRIKVQAFIDALPKMKEQFTQRPVKEDNAAVIAALKALIAQHTKA